MTGFPPDPINKDQFRDLLVGIKGKSKAKKAKPKMHWLAYILPIFIFILNKAITVSLKLASDTQNIIDILFVIAMVTGLTLYVFFQTKNSA